MELCAPALMCLVFFGLQAIFYVLRKNVSSAVHVGIIAAMVTGLLQWLCMHGFDSVAWMMVFIPFIYMLTIIFTFVYLFASGKMTPQPPPSKTGNVFDRQGERVTSNAGNVVYRRAPANVSGTTTSTTVSSAGWTPMPTAADVNNYNVSPSPYSAAP